VQQEHAENTQLEKERARLTERVTACSGLQAHLGHTWSTAVHKLARCYTMLAQPLRSNCKWEQYGHQVQHVGQRVCSRKQASEIIVIVQATDETGKAVHQCNRCSKHEHNCQILQHLELGNTVRYISLGSQCRHT
jgi:hypothetical protein